MAAIKRGHAETIVAASSEIRAEFERWLASACRSGVRLVVLEGLTGSGKTTLIETPFSVGAGCSVNIEIDGFCRQEIPLKGISYLDAIDRSALQLAVRAALASAAPVVVMEGPIARPLVDAIAKIKRVHVRHAYLKRMMHLKPDFWIDEEYLNDPDDWPPTDFHRSIYQYHAERQPWLNADLVLERIEVEPPAHYD
jgi:chloramphenicol 3-O-phosphotransferase